MNDMRIKLLETQIDKNTFDDMEILEGTNAIFPAINSLSLANHTFYTKRRPFGILRSTCLLEDV